jgi:hypothetical protein
MTHLCFFYWHYFSDRYRACKKCGNTQTKILVSQAPAHDPLASDVWEWKNLEYNEFINGVNEYANYLRTHNQSIATSKESRTKMLEHFKSLDV